MKDEYPEENELKQIRNWEIAGKDTTNENLHSNIQELIEFIQERWRYTGNYFQLNGRYLELHTGGWSGNEDIIHALRLNLFWMIYWQKSVRGGHYYFKLPESFEIK